MLFENKVYVNNIYNILLSLTKTTSPSYEIVIILVM